MQQVFLLGVDIVRLHLKGKKLCIIFMLLCKLYLLLFYSLLPML